MEEFARNSESRIRELEEALTLARLEKNLILNKIEQEQKDHDNSLIQKLKNIKNDLQQESANTAAQNQYMNNLNEMQEKIKQAELNYQNTLKQISLSSKKKQKLLKQNIKELQEKLKN